jgi:hypothetical protein
MKNPIFLNIFPFISLLSLIKEKAFYFAISWSESKRNTIVFAAEFIKF